MTSRFTGRSLLRASCVILVAACSPLDVLGYGEDVIDSSQQGGDTDPLADDNIANKHPVFDETLTIKETFGQCDVTLNKSGAVTKLDILPYAAGDAFSGKLFHGYTDALAAIGTRPMLPSMELLGASLKPFDDGLYAAIELGANDGSNSSLIAKRQLFLDLLTELTTRATSGAAAEQPLAMQAATLLGAAAQLAEDPVPATLQPGVTSLLGQFNADAFSSTPIGFYTWTPELQTIFQRDRLLQNPTSVGTSFGAFASMAAAMNGKPDLATRYQGVLGLYAGLTNPYVDHSVADLLPLVPDGNALASVDALQTQFQSMFPDSSSCPTSIALTPASDSPESKLFRKLYCAGQIPAGTSLIDVLIQQIQSGQLDLTPTANSGWYDRQVWALETLLVPDDAPEKDHLFLTKRYKEKLVETFKTLITEARETHVKQLDTGEDELDSAPPPPVDIYPLLPVEPFPTFYLRTARGYSFLETLLHAAMGDAFMKSAARVLEDGTTAPMSLGDELHQIACRSYGFHVLASGSIGMRHQMTADETTLYAPDDCAAAASTWLSTLATDSDLARDTRVIVPVERDDAAGVIHYWAVIGTSVLHAGTSFYPGYEPKVVDAGFCTFRSFVEQDPYLVTGQQVEVTIRSDRPPPTRKELRDLCDAHDNVADIVSALEAL